MSMTLRQLVVCASPLIGSHTIREHMSATSCLTMGGDLTINGELVRIKEDIITLTDSKNDIIVLIKEPVIILESNEIIKIEEGIMYGIC